MHLIYDIYIVARRLYDQCRHYLLDFCYGPTTIDSEIDYVREAKSQLKKSVNHLVVILGNESISIKDIVKITVWSRAADISFLSFYDHCGRLKKSKSALDEALLHKCGIKSQAPRCNGYRNGFSGHPSPRVTLLDMSDGKAGIVRVAQQLCEKAHTQKLDPKEVDKELINNCIMKESGVPEPDLALYCGDVCSTFGFLPWHSRVTEFLPLNSHHDISAQKFVSLLRRYSKCEQRLGT